MTIFLDLASGFALKLRSIIMAFVSLFILFFIFYGHNLVSKRMIEDHNLLIIIAPALIGYSFFKFVNYSKSLEGEQ